MIELRILKSKDYPGLSSGLEVIMRVLIRGRQGDRSRDQSNTTTSQGMWAPPRTRNRLSPRNSSRNTALIMC